MADTDKSPDSPILDKKPGSPGTEDAVKTVFDIAKEIVRVTEAETPKKLIPVGRPADSGSGGLAKEAAGVTARIAELEATMNNAISLVDITKAEPSAEDADIAKAIKSAINEMEPWRNLATGETMKVKAAKEEVEALKSEVENLRQELGIANAKFLAAEGEAVTLAIGREEPNGVPAESLLEPSTNLVQSYLCRSIFPTEDKTQSNDTANFSTKRLWPNGQVITYRFTDGHANQRAKVTKAIPEWSRYANITFKFVPNDALLRISFKNSSECWSTVGTDLQKTTANVPYTMALGAVSASSNTTAGERALILHQFGHVLGLVHEHMCPSETDAVSLKQDAILEHPSFRDSDPSISKDVDIYTNTSVTNYASPDLSSIMIFSMPGALNEGNLTIEPNMALSPLDKAFMVINYPRMRVHSLAPEWTLCHALLIANVDENTSRAITEEHDITKRRMLFANFLSRTRARQQDRTKLVHPAPKIVDNLSIPVVQDALHALFIKPNDRPEAKEVLADIELKEVLMDALNHLTSYPEIRKVIQQGKAVHVSHTPQGKPDSPGSESAFVGSLLRAALMLHGAIKHCIPSGDAIDNTGPKKVDAVTTLYTQLSQHSIFRAGMERAVEEQASSTQAMPDVGALLERLVERPAVLRAFRKALL